MTDEEREHKEFPTVRYLVHAWSSHRTLSDSFRVHAESDAQAVVQARDYLADQIDSRPSWWGGWSVYRIEREDGRVVYQANGT